MRARRIGHGHRPGGAGGRDLPVQQLVDAERRGDRGERGAHVGPVGDAVRHRPRVDPVTQPFEAAGRTEHHPLVVELGGDQLPALVLLAHEHVGGDAHVVEVRRVHVVGAVGGDDRRPGVAGVPGVDDQHRDALVLGGVGVGAHREPDVVGGVPAGGPELLTVHHVVGLAVASTRRAVVRSDARSVPASGLAVADREVHVAGEDVAEEHVLLLLRAERLQRRADGLQGDRGRCTSERAASFAKICCSVSPNPCPPCSVGQPTPIQPSEPICLMTSVEHRRRAARSASRGGPRGWRQLVEVVADRPA